VYFWLKNLRFLTKKYTLALKNLLKGRFSSVRERASKTRFYLFHVPRKRAFYGFFRALPENEFFAREAQKVP
jgi:hypothetical protein